MILLLGNGLLGSEVKRALDLMGLRYQLYAHDKVDLTFPLPLLIDKLGRYTWDFSYVINTVGFTKVDAAESQKDEALALNAYAANSLAQLCRRNNATLVHVSTDFIFDGSHAVSQPYIEEDTPNPVNYYGYTKLLGEQMIKDSGCRYLIVRSGKLYNQKKGFIFSILKKMREESYICGIKNQIFSPTNAFNLANQLVSLIQNGITGTYHATNIGYTSAFDLINWMKRVINSEVRVDESSLYENFSPARRPAMTVLSMKKLESLGLLKMPDWRDSLEYTLRNL